MAAFAPFSTDAVVPASLAIAAALGSDPAGVAGSLAAFFAGVGLGQLVHGPLSDRYGRRPPLLAGLAVFTLASAACVLAPDIATLGWLRFLQGLGGCAGSVASRAVIRDLAEGTAAIRLLSRLILVAGIAPIFAPTLGGLTLELVGWRAIFVGLTGYGVLLLLLVGRILPETLPAGARRREGFGAVLVRYARLLRDPSFFRPAAAGMLPLAGMFAYIGGSPLVLMGEHGLTPALYAVVFGANAAAFVGAAQLAGPVAARLGPERALMLVQLWLLAVAAGVLLAGLGQAPTVLLLGLFAAYLAGCGAVSPLSVGLAMAGHGATAGSASAVLGAMQFGLGAVAVALLGALGGGAAGLGAVLSAFALAGLAMRR